MHICVSLCWVERLPDRQRQVVMLFHASCVLYGLVCVCATEGERDLSIALGQARSSNVASFLVLHDGQSILGTAGYMSRYVTKFFCMILSHAFFCAPSNTCTGFVARFEVRGTSQLRVSVCMLCKWSTRGGHLLVDHGFQVL